MNFEKHNNALKIFKIMSNANRLKILDMIYNSPNRSLLVNEIEEKLDCSQGNISTHLALMRNANILQAKQDGTNMNYSIKNPTVTELVKKML